MQKYSLTTASEVFKEVYYKKSENLYNSANKILMRVKLRNDFVGSKRHVCNPLSYSGGVGSGSLPYAGVASYGDAEIVAKKVYGRCKVEREAIAAALNDKGAFVRATAETVKKTVESYVRNRSRILFGDGTGKLGTGDGSTNVTGTGTSVDPYVVVMSTTDWKEANWEEEDYVHYHNDNSSTQLLRVQEVDPENYTIKFQDIGGSSNLTAGSPTSNLFYMQFSTNQFFFILQVWQQVCCRLRYQVILTRKNKYCSQASPPLGA